MLKASLATALTLLLMGGACGVAFGHGGQYRGPSDTVPPNLGGGGDTTPPGNPGGPATPGPGAPTTGGKAGPVTGGPPAGPPGGGMRGGGLGGATKRGGSSEGYERWEFWWEYNKEPFLELRARMREGVVRSGSVGFLTGRSKPSDAVTSNRPSQAEVKDKIIPELIKLLDETQPDVVDSATIAIGRSLTNEDAPMAIDALKHTLAHAEKTPRESATLALGILGSLDAVDALRAILNDTAEGRKLTNHPTGCEHLVRSFAAAALGLIGQASVVPDLKKIVTDNSTQSDSSLRAMAILALGMIRGSNQEEIVTFLQGLMTDRSLVQIVRAQAPIALGRLNRQEGGSAAARAALSSIVALLEDDKSDNDLRRSLAICIGMLATVEDDKATDSLINAIGKVQDEQTRNFAIMALAEIGSRDQDPAKHESWHKKIEDFFTRELAQPKKATAQPFFALALGVYARNEKQPVELRIRAIQKLQDQFNSTNNPSHQGAMAIAIGLLDGKTAAEDLWKKFEDSNDSALKGYIAVSLGLMRQNERSEKLREVIVKQGLDPKYRLQLARSLGLMADPGANPLLIKYLTEAQTTAESSSAAQALGLIGDKSAIPDLLTIMRDKSKQPLQRGFAAVALGMISEKSSLPWNTVFAVDSNYRAKVDSLSEILDIL